MRKYFLWIAALVFVSFGTHPAEAVIREVSSQLPHAVRDLSDAYLALQVRLDALNSLADGDELDIASYIFAPDRVGGMILRKIVEKKKEFGTRLRVRIMVDAVPFAGERKIDPVLARALGEIGVQFKYFNRTSIFNVPRAIRRDHRKLFIVKKQNHDPYVILGGRNLADEYFNQSKKYNFLDRDISIQGPLSNSILKSFAEQFNHPFAQGISEYEGRPPNEQTFLRGASPKGQELAEKNYQSELRHYRARWARAQSILHPSAADLSADEALAIEIGRGAGPIGWSHPTLTANDVVFFTDPPGIKSGEEASTVVLSRELAKTQRDLLMENFQYAPKGLVKKTLDGLADRGLDILTLTNGKNASEEAILYYFNYFKERAAKSAHPKNVNFENFQGKLSDRGSEENLPPLESRVIVHSKSFVQDGVNSFVTTINLAPRSAYLNDECGLLVRQQPELANSISVSTRERMRNATPFRENGDGFDKARTETPDFFYRDIGGPLAQWFLEDDF